jgi:hypothetical protein
MSTNDTSQVPARGNFNSLGERVNWQDTVMSKLAVNRIIGPHGSNIPLWVKWDLTQPDYDLCSKQAQLSFEAGEQSRARLIADLQETVNSMMQDNSTLTVALEQARADERKAIGGWLDSKPVKRSSFAQCYRKVIDEEIDALLKGERPNG